MKNKLIIIFAFLTSSMFASVNTSQVFNELIKQEIKNPRIVLKQAILETGWFTSNVFKTCNNLFGMTCVKGGKRTYQTYKNWKQSIAYYKKWQEKYYEGGDYYSFLECVYKRSSGECVRYATSPTYVDKLKSIKLDV